MSDLIRLARKSDSENILRIYAPYIEDTAVSFETEVPTVNDFANRIETICQQYPYLVYQADDKTVGYAYASRHRERDAYRYDVDVSIYVLNEYQGSGVAHKLYGCLFKILKEQGYYNAYAACTTPNEKSLKFHSKFGFLLIGTHHNTGYKFGKWHDVIWLEKMINEITEKPVTIKSINELSKEPNFSRNFSAK